MAWCTEFDVCGHITNGGDWTERNLDQVQISLVKWFNIDFSVLNNLLFTFAAFWGVHSVKTILNIVISSYVIFIVTSLA